MRWLPDRTRTQRPILRLFQIAQGTVLTLIFVVTAIFGEILVGRISFWSIFSVVAWIIFWGQCGWSATLIVSSVAFSVLTPACDAPWIDASTIQAAIAGLGIGGWMDVCGLATTRIASAESNDIKDTPETMAVREPPPVAGDLQ